MLLAGDVLAWHNPVLPEDVSGDSIVAPNDVFLIVSELYKNGPRQLVPGPQALAGGSGATLAGTPGTATVAVLLGPEQPGSPAAPTAYLDVNGDNYLTAADALEVIAKLRENLQVDVVRMEFQITDAGGTPVEALDVGQSFQLNVYVEDLRDTAPEDTFGVAAAYLDVFYDSPLVSISGPVAYGPDYSFFATQPDTSTPGEIRNAGNVQTNLFSPLGQGKFLLLTVPLTVDGAPVVAADDDAGTDAALSVQEDSPGVTIDVLVNDTSGGQTQLQGGPPDSTPEYQTLFFEPVTPAVSTDEIDYGTDTLLINPVGPLSITGVGPTSNGGTAVVVAGGTAIRYTPSPAANGLAEGETDTDSFQYTITDGLSTATATVTVTLVGQNDAPAAQDAGFSTDEHTPISDSLVPFASDPDANDTLTFSGDVTSAMGAAVSVDADGTFSYDPTVSAALRALLVGQAAADTFSYTVDDGHGGTDTRTVTINVDGVNDPPVAASDSGPAFTTDEDVAFVTGNVLANDSAFPDVGETLSVASIDISGTKGQVVDNGDGTFSYDPAGMFESLHDGQTATDTFVYTVSDGNGGIDTAVVKITIRGVNDPPVAADDSSVGFETDEATAFVTGNVLANDSDAEGDTLSVAGIDTSATKGQVVDNGDGTFNYDPAGMFESLGAGQAATDTFTYTVSDGHGGQTTATVTITVNGLNDPPAAADDLGAGFATDEDTGFVTPDVLANDTDPDGDTLAIAYIDTSGTLGQVTNNGDGTFNYDPAGKFDSLGAGQTDTDTFTYTIGDGHGGQATAAVTITITGVNDAPVAGDDNPFVEEGSADNVLNVLDNDSDPDNGDTLTIIAVGATDNGGTAVAAGDGLSITYTPAASFIGTETFTYTVRDSHGATATATVEVNVEPLTLPRARNDAFTVAEDSQAVELDVFINDLISAEGTAGIAITGDPDHGGTVVLTGPTTLEYTPAANFFGTEKFRYTLSDGVGAPAEAVVTVTVTPVNDVPAINDDSFGTDEDTAFVTPNVLGNDTDDDGDVLSVTGVNTSGTLGQVTDRGDGTFLYDPAGVFDSLGALQTATDAFTYTASDGHGGSGTARVTVTITGVNDAPVAADDDGAGFATDQDTAFVTGSVLANDSDVENDTLSVASVDASGVAGQLIDNGDGTFSYDPAGAFDWLGAGQTATETFTYTVSDGNGGTDTATVTITISGLNDSPAAEDDLGTGFSTDEDTPFVTGSVLANDTDPDGDVLTVTGIDASGVVGLLVDNGDGTFSYDPAGMFESLGAGDTWAQAFTYTVSDGHGGTSSATVTITVGGVNDAPVAVDDAGAGFATGEDTPFVTGDVLANDSDAENDSLSISDLGTSATLGDVISNGDGTFSYDPAGAFESLAEGQTATDTFTYTVSDGHGGSATASVTIAVTGVNDPPVAQAATFGTDEDTPTGGSLVAKVVDPDAGETLTFSGDAISARGAAVVVDSDGTFSYDPRAVAALQELLPGQSLDDTFDYTVTDRSGASAGATVKITVAGVNDLPTAAADPISGILEDSSDNVLDVLANDSLLPDVGETLTIVSVGPTSAGGAVTNDGSQLRYAPAKDFFGTETFTYTVSDGNGGTATATVSVTVEAQNDPPTANDDPFRFIANTGSHVLDVLANDTISPDVGEVLSILSTGTPSGGGTVVNQGQQLLYTPAPGFKGTETFSYTIDDGNGGTDTATVSVEVVDFVPSSLAGKVFNDTDRDGIHDLGERAIGGVWVRLTGVDMFAGAVSLSTTTLGDGSYCFTDLAPGEYTLSAAQPAFLLDGPERIGTQGGTSPMNDQVSVSIGVAGAVFGEGNHFCELGLQPQYISVWDFLNTNSRKGILFATDAQSGQLWFSFLDGWEGFSLAEATISPDRSTLRVTVVDQAANSSTFNVAFRESATLHIRGSAGTRYLVQVLGPASSFGLVAAPKPAEVAPSAASAPATSASTASASAAPATGLSVGSAPASSAEPADVLPLILSALVEADGQAKADSTAGPAAPGPSAEEHALAVDAALADVDAERYLLAVDAVLCDTRDGDVFGSSSDGVWGTW